MNTSAHAGSLDDYRWLVSEQAKPALAVASQPEDERSLLAASIALRKEVGLTRTHLVVALAQLRRRARLKFKRGGEMFFTRQLLEQATGEQIGVYKAQRFPAGVPVVDLCCGIGGDLLALGSRAKVCGVDRDEIAVVLAEANCRCNGLTSASLRVDDATRCELGQVAAWHVDPDRRPEGRRTTTLELHTPDLQAMQDMVAKNRNGAIKLAPAAAVPEGWEAEAELEWIGNRGECRQQVAWFGDLARAPGQRTATVFANCADTSCTIRGRAGLEIPVAPQVDRFVLEPHAVVLAAGLTGVLAAQHGLSQIAPEIAYLTGPNGVACPTLASFEVQEVLPFDLRRVRSVLRQRGIARLEVKKRGVSLSPEQVVSQLSVKGEEAGTLILMPKGKRVLAILCRRLTPADAPAETNPDSRRADGS